MKTLKVDITQELLDNDKNSNSDDDRNETCPVAIALTNMGYKEVRVGNQLISTNKNNRVYVMRVRGRLQRFLRELDNNMNKKPTSFTLNFQELT